MCIYVKLLRVQLDWFHSNRFSSLCQLNILRRRVRWSVHCIQSAKSGKKKGFNTFVFLAFYEQTLLSPLKPFVTLMLNWFIACKFLRSDLTQTWQHYTISLIDLQLGFDDKVEIVVPQRKMVLHCYGFLWI